MRHRPWHVMALLLAVVIFATRRHLRRAMLRLRFGAVEWKARVELAGLYRAAGNLGWDEWIYNHISLRVPGEEAMLVKPFGLKFEEVTASKLVKVDFQGNVLDGGYGNGSPEVNRAGFVVHAGVHAGRSDVACIIHHHQVDCTAVSTVSPYRLLPITQNAAVIASLVSPVRHPYSGIRTSFGEKLPFLQAVGAAKVLLMENHGVLVFGATAAEAFWVCWSFALAAVQQSRLLAAAGNDLHNIKTLSEEVLNETSTSHQRFLEEVSRRALGEREFAAALRAIPDGFRD